VLLAFDKSHPATLKPRNRSRWLTQWADLQQKAAKSYLIGSLGEPSSSRTAPIETQMARRMSQAAPEKHL